MLSTVERRLYIGSSSFQAPLSSCWAQYHTDSMIEQNYFEIDAPPLSHQLKKDLFTHGNNYL